MFIDTLYFHYVVIWKKTDLSRFFFYKMSISQYVEILEPISKLDGVAH